MKMVIAIVRAVIMVVRLITPSAPDPPEAAFAMRPIAGCPDVIDAGAGWRDLHNRRGRHRSGIIHRCGCDYDRSRSDYHRCGYANAETKPDAGTSRTNRENRRTGKGGQEYHFSFHNLLFEGICLT